MGMGIPGGASNLKKFNNILEKRNEKERNGILERNPFVSKGGPKGRFLEE